MKNHMIKATRLEIHYHECGMVIFHRGYKIHGQGCDFSESYTMHLGTEVEFPYSKTSIKEANGSHHLSNNRHNSDYMSIIVFNSKYINN